MQNNKSKSTVKIVLILAALIVLAGMSLYFGTDFLAETGTAEPTPSIVILREVFIDLNQDQQPDLLLYGEAILNQGGTIQEIK